MPPQPLADRPQPNPDCSFALEHVADEEQLKSVPPDDPQYPHVSPDVYSGVCFSVVPSQL